jgi:hypothetical protein
MACKQRKPPIVNFEAEYLRRSELPTYVRAKYNIDSTYAAWGALANRGGGPGYRVVQMQAYYLRQDIDAWCRAQLEGPVFRSGSERREFFRRQRAA